MTVVTVIFFCYLTTKATFTPEIFNANWARTGGELVRFSNI